MRRNNNARMERAYLPCLCPMVPRIMQKDKISSVMGNDDPTALCSIQELLFVACMSPMQRASCDRLVSEGVQFIGDTGGDIIIEIEMRHPRLCSVQTRRRIRTIGSNPCIDDRAVLLIVRNRCFDNFNRQFVIGCNVGDDTIDGGKIADQRPYRYAPRFQTCFVRSRAVRIQFNVLLDVIAGVHRRLRMIGFGTRPICERNRSMMPMSYPSLRQRTHGAASSWSIILPVRAVRQPDAVYSSPTDAGQAA